MESLEKLKQAIDELKIPENKYISSAFIMSSKKQINQEHWQIDIYNPTTDKITSYKNKQQVQKDSKVFKKPTDKIEKLDINQVKITPEQAINKAKEELKKHNETEKQIIILLQTLDKSPIWNITIITPCFNMLNIKFNAINGEKLLSEFSSLLSFKN